MVTSTFTPESAQSFHRYSPINAATVKMRLACGCEPYRDVFTYNRWLALGYQVQRGERSIKIPVIVERENEDNETIKRLFKSHVFCRCQVKPIGSKQETKTEPEITPEPIKPIAIQPIIEPIQPIIEPKTEPIKPVNHSESQIDNMMKGWHVV
jgi:N-terminal domain of anti-restriction factor ArdC